MSNFSNLFKAISLDTLYFSNGLNLIRYVPTGVREDPELFSISVRECDKISLDEFGVVSPIFTSEDERLLDRFLVEHPEITYVGHSNDDVWIPSHYLGYFKSFCKRYLDQV